MRLVVAVTLLSTLVFSDSTTLNTTFDSATIIRTLTGRSSHVPAVQLMGARGTCAATAPMPVLGLGRTPPERMPVLRPDTTHRSTMPVLDRPACYLMDSAAVGVRLRRESRR